MRTRIVGALLFAALAAGGCDDSTSSPGGNGGGTGGDASIGGGGDGGMATMDGGGDAGGGGGGGGGGSGDAYSQLGQLFLDSFCGALADGCVPGIPDSQWEPGDSLYYRALVAVYSGSGKTCQQAILTEADTVEAIGLGILEDFGYDPANANVAFDATAAAACANAMRSRCVAPNHYFNVPECRALVDGKVALGGSCTEDVECVGNAYCGDAISGNVCTGGKCIARVSTATTCDPTEDSCSVPAGTIGEAHCDNSTNTCVINTWTVTAGAAAGASCGLVGSNPDVVLCSTGTYCDSTTHQCTTLPTSGSSCAGDNSACPSGQVCVSGTCTALQVLTTVGADCSSDASLCDPYGRLDCVRDCSSGPCTSTCQSLGGTGAAGDACLPGTSTATCSSGLRCAENPSGSGSLAGVCASVSPTPAAENGACNPWVHWAPVCAEGLRCTGNDPTTATCKPYPYAVGVACQGGTDCVSTAYCDYSTHLCVAKLAVDSVCTGGDQCQSGLCMYRNSANRCTQPLADGSACTGSSQCASGSCDQGSCGPATGRAVGAGCTVDSQCASQFCGGTTYGSYTCRTPLSLGDSCTGMSLGNGHYDLCGTGLVCNTLTTNQCEAKRTDGQPCPSYAGYACVSGMCDTADGSSPTGYVCTPKLANTTACSSDAQCASGRCVSSSSTCQAKLADGQQCVDTGDCATSPCRWDSSVGHNTCHYAAAGESCSAAADCAPASPICRFGCVPYGGGTSCGSMCFAALAPDGDACQKASDCMSNVCTAGQSGSHCGTWPAACFVGY